ncbi:MAG: GNAT family N-acetyltransferase [Candidatus Sericytochromatia bacterium]|nr:GNAT family N-acetyltransferase [Candidatus Sericytochromatia bacterium]
MEVTLQAESVSAADLGPMIESLITPYLEESYPESFADAEWRSHWHHRLQGWLQDDTVRVRTLRTETWVGFAACRLIGRDGTTLAELVDLYVVPDMRRHGLGSHLVEDVIAWSAQNGAREMSIAIKVRHQTAVDFFAQLGFSPQRLLLTRWI